MLQISDLRHEPQFFETVADRIWQAWWKLDGYSSKQIADGLAAAIKGERIPFAIVAHEGGEFVGSTLGIASEWPLARNTHPGSLRCGLSRSTG